MPTAARREEERDMEATYYLLSYVWRFVGSASLEFSNSVTKERPAEWLLRVRSQHGNRCDYTLLSAIEITEGEYGRLEGEL